MESGEDNTEKAMVFNNGLTVLDMKVIGKWIRLMDLENCFTQMGTFMKGIGKMIKLMEKEFISIKMEQPMMANGKKTSSMDMELRPGLMVQYTKDIIVKEKSMEKEN